MSRRAFLARRNCGAIMLCAASWPRAWHHPERRGRKHRSGKCDRQQARAKHDKTGNGHRKETVRSEFFAHGTPPTARKSDCESQVETPNVNRSILGPPRASLRLATCNRPFQVTSETRTIEIDGSILRRYASDNERVSGELYGGFSARGQTGPSLAGVGLIPQWRREFSN